RPLCGQALMGKLKTPSYQTTPHPADTSQATDSHQRSTASSTIPRQWPWITYSPAYLTETCATTTAEAHTMTCGSVLSAQLALENTAEPRSRLSCRQSPPTIMESLAGTA